MRRKIMLLIATIIAITASFTLVSASQATTSSVDLGITGSVVAGVRSASAGQEVPFTFTITNHSTTASADLSFTFTITHGAAAASDYVCPTTGTRYDINPDTPSCEPGFLANGAKSSAAILVTPTVSSGTLTVKACASNLNGVPDPVSSNNCKTLTISIV